MGIQRGLGVPGDCWLRRSLVPEFRFCIHFQISPVALKKKSAHAPCPLSLSVRNVIVFSTSAVDSPVVAVISADHGGMYSKCEMRELCQGGSSSSGKLERESGSPPQRQQAPPLHPPRSACNTLCSLSLFPFPTQVLAGICDISEQIKRAPDT